MISATKGFATTLSGPQANVGPAPRQQLRSPLDGAEHVAQPRLPQPQVQCRRDTASKQAAMKCGFAPVDVCVVGFSSTSSTNDGSTVMRFSRGRPPHVLS